MRWYQAISCDNTVQRPFIGDEGYLGDLQDHDLYSCTQIAKWTGSAWTKGGMPGNDGEPDDVLQTCFPFPVFSLRLRSGLEKVGIRGIQYLPIHVIRYDRSEIDGFEIANVTNCLNALDLDRSEYVRFPNNYLIERRRGEIRAITWAILKSSEIQDYDIMRLSQFKPPLYVSERFVRLFREHNFTGYSFRQVNTA